MQATIVCHFGDKPDGLRALLTDCQDVVDQMLGPRFRRYEIGQIHATLVGLERDESSPERFLNRNYKMHRGAEVAMNYSGMLDYLRQACRVSFQVQLGGFQDIDYPFKSRGERPFVRSFFLRDNNVVVMGWPLCDTNPAKALPPRPTMIQESSLYPSALECIRKAVQGFGVLHAYHREPSDVDNDFYLRIGTVSDADTIPPRERVRLQDGMRRMLASRSPCMVQVNLFNVFVAFYEAEELALGRTRAYCLADEQVDAEFIRRGYNFGSETR